MNEEKLRIIKEILSVRDEYFEFKQLWAKTAIRKNYAKMFACLMLSVFSIFAIKYPLIAKILKIDGYEYFVFGLGLVAVIFLLYVNNMFSKLTNLEIENLTKKSISELEIKLNDFEKRYSDYKDSAIKRIASDTAFSVIIIIFLFIRAISIYIKSGFNLSNLWEKIYQPEGVFISGMFFFISFLIGIVFSLGMTPKKIDKKQSNLENKIRKVFIIGIDFSILNPELSNEKN